VVIIRRKGILYTKRKDLESQKGIIIFVPTPEMALGEILILIVFHTTEFKKSQGRFSHKLYAI